MTTKENLYQGIKGLAELSQPDKDWVVAQLIPELQPHQVDAIDDFVALLRAAVTRPKVFLSHSGADKPFVRTLATYLRKRHVTVWLDEAELHGGSPLVQTISDAINRGDIVIAVLSKKSVKSEWVAKELQWAMTREIEAGTQIRVIPIVKEVCDVPIFLKDKLRIDFTVKHKKNRPLLLRSILKQLA
jgi:hypothetical protein